MNEKNKNITNDEIEMLMESELPGVNRAIKRYEIIPEGYTDNQFETYMKFETDIINKSGLLYEVVKKTRRNFVKAFTYDDTLKSIRLNEMSKKKEITDEDGNVRDWDYDVDGAAKRDYIEYIYGLDRPSAFKDALIEVANIRKYNPLKDIIELEAWDGVPRVEEFLIKWMKAEDTPMVREITRTMFAGIIRRLYDPGCKFDTAIVLVGDPGNGKTTICKWLALDDKYYNSIKSFDKTGYEGIERRLICEVEELAELLADTNLKNAALAKSFFSSSSDNFRAAYGPEEKDRPRHAVLIGTTNYQEFIVDATSARRFLPVKVYSNAEELYDKKEECMNYIVQCYREMKHYMEENSEKAAIIINRDMRDELKNYVDRFMVYSSWKGIIEEFIKDKKIVCIPQIKKEALRISGNEEKRKTSNKILSILTEMGCISTNQTAKFIGLGKQKSIITPYGLDKLKELKEVKEGEKVERINDAA